MTSEQIIIDNLPDKCDTCGGNRSNLMLIEQVVEKPMGKMKRAVGYHCGACDTSHLYRINP